MPPQALCSFGCCRTVKYNFDPIMRGVKHLGDSVRRIRLRDLAAATGGDSNSLSSVLAGIVLAFGGPLRRPPLTLPVRRPSAKNLSVPRPACCMRPAARPPVLHRSGGASRNRPHGPHTFVARRRKRRDRYAITIAAMPATRHRPCRNPQHHPDHRQARHTHHRRTHRRGQNAVVRTETTAGRAAPHPKGSVQQAGQKASGRSSYQEPGPLCAGVVLPMRSDPKGGLTQTVDTDLGG
jgi:hypothetical protein